MGVRRIEHYGAGMMKCNIERRSVGHGRISKTFCPVCDRDVDLYLLEHVGTTHPPVSSSSEMMEEYKQSPRYYFGSCTEFKDGKFQCPECGDMLTLDYVGFPTTEFYLNCNHYMTYCDNCDMPYDVLGIKPPLREYTVEEVLERIENLVDEYSIVGLKEDYEGFTRISCPVCGKSIPIANSFDKCPRCGGKPEIIDEYDYD